MPNTISKEFNKIENNYQSMFTPLSKHRTNGSHTCKTISKFGSDIYFKAYDVCFVEKSHCLEEWEIGLKSGRSFTVDKIAEANKILKMCGWILDDRS